MGFDWLTTPSYEFAADGKLKAEDPDIIGISGVFRAGTVACRPWWF